VAGIVPAIHAFTLAPEGVDARDKHGNGGEKGGTRNRSDSKRVDPQWISGSRDSRKSRNTATRLEFLSSSG
jgi:hypothetical protein